jgi:hypothetical protein
MEPKQGISREAAVIRLRNLRQRCVTGLATIDKKTKWRESERATAKLELSYEIAALDLAIECLGRAGNVTSIPGTDPASFAGA